MNVVNEPGTRCQRSFDHEGEGENRDLSGQKCVVCPPEDFDV